MAQISPGGAPDSDERGRVFAGVVPGPGQHVPASPALEKTRPDGALSEPLTSTATVLKRLAVRYRHLYQELALIDAELDAILALHAPMLRDLQGVGTDVASQLLVTVGDNPERVTSEEKFAALVGVAPVPASSGKTTRHRLSRAGYRQANKAIHSVVLVRMRWDSRTGSYVARRRQEGKSTKEIMRCLKRYVARELYEQLLHPRPAPDAHILHSGRPSSADLHRQQKQPTEPPPPDQRRNSRPHSRAS